MLHNRRPYYLLAAATLLQLSACSAEPPVSGGQFPTQTVSGTGGVGVTGVAGSGSLIPAPVAGVVASAGVTAPPLAGIGNLGTAGVIANRAGSGAAAASGAGGTPAIAGTAAPSGGIGGMAGTGPAPGGTGGVVAPSGKGCGQTLPAVTDYGAMGPFPTTTVNNTGPDGMFTVIRPKTLGDNGFKHPPTTWGNGITTTPSLYPGLLNGIASHGFVIVASNSSSVTAQMMTAGLDWLVQQNDKAGDYQGKLDTKCLISIGYSLGGGAAVTTGGHADVIATVSFHGLTGAAGALHGPLLLFTSTMDDFVSAAGFVDPTFKMSSVQTFYATLTGAGDGGHLTPIGDAGVERAPAIAWLRLWAYGDQGARKYFDGADCLLCKTPWGNPQRKNWPP
jgi:hypothetical protein